MSTFWKLVKTKPVKLILLNVAFLLCCVPVVTIPAAVCALSEVLVHFLRDGDCRPFSDLWKALTKGFWGYCKAGYAIAVPIGLCAWMAMYLYPQFRLSAWAAIFFIAACILLAFFAIASVFYFAMAGGVIIPLPAMVKNAFLLGILHAKEAAPLAMLLGLFYVLEVQFFPYSAPVAALVGIAFPSLMSVCIAWPHILERVVGQGNSPADVASQEQDTKQD